MPCCRVPEAWQAGRPSQGWRSALHFNAPPPPHPPRPAPASRRHREASAAAEQEAALMEALLSVPSEDVNAGFQKLLLLASWRRLLLQPRACLGLH